MENTEKKEQIKCVITKHDKGHRKEYNYKRECQGLWGEGNGNFLINEYKVSVLQDEYILEICCATL